MKTLLTTLLCLVSLIAFAEEAPLAAVQAADDARVAAMKSPDRDKLSAIFSDELHYAHSSGVVDSKTSFIDVLLKGTTKYQEYDYQERKFTFPAPGIALMTGSTKLKLGLETGSIEPILGFLAVWRLEKGQWHFLAWQSCKLPTPAK
jgi:hypothetical protein